MELRVYNLHSVDMLSTVCFGRWSSESTTCTVLTCCQQCVLASCELRSWSNSGLVRSTPCLVQSTPCLLPCHSSTLLSQTSAEVLFPFRLASYFSTAFLGSSHDVLSANFSERTLN
eukprot:scaffold1033_cov65-Cyclotella_meneghiniana.AAC.2